MVISHSRCDGLGRAVAPSRQRPGGHLVKRRGGGVPLGVQVPAWRLPQGKQRVEVARRAGPDVLGRGPRQREIEQHEVQLVAPADHADGDVVGLDVAVRDALLLQVIHDVQQVLAEALEQIDVEPAFLAQPLAQGLDPLLVLVDEDRAHQKADAVADLGTVRRTRRCAGVAAYRAPRLRP